MASIHITEIQELVGKKGQKDAIPYNTSGEGFFLEIRFDKPAERPLTVDQEFKNKVITADCPFGNVTIVFDEFGQLASLDLS